MLAVLLSLAVAVAAFAWALSPLFSEGGEIPQTRGEEELSVAVERSLRELETDLALGKIHRDDLAAIEDHLRKEMGG